MSANPVRKWQPIEVEPYHALSVSLAHDAETGIPLRADRNGLTKEHIMNDKDRFQALVIASVNLRSAIRAIDYIDFAILTEAEAAQLDEAWMILHRAAIAIENRKDAA